MTGKDQDREDITPGNHDTGQGSSSELVATATERQERLTQIMRSSVAFPALIKTGHVIAAIDTLNRMDGLYSVPFGFNDNRVINIICDQETAELIGHIGERTKLLPPGIKPEDAPAPDIVESSLSKEASGER